MVGIAMITFVLGFLVGLFTYFAARTGYKVLMEVLEEEKRVQKNTFSTSDQLNS